VEGWGGEVSMCHNYTYTYTYACTVHVHVPFNCTKRIPLPPP